MKTLSADLLDQLLAQAAASPRRRAHHNVHASADEPVQRFLVGVQPGTYFRPHRHLTRSELAVVLRGRFDVVVFDNHGTVTDRHAIGDGTGRFAYELPPCTWHTLVALTEGVFLEIKQGPYDPATAAEFAAWAPAEGDARVNGLLARLRDATPGQRVAETAGGRQPG